MTSQPPASRRVSIAPLFAVPTLVFGAALGIALQFAPSSASAEIYRWVDASGGVTFSDHAPPAGVRVTDVIQVPQPAPAAAVDAAHEAEMRVLTQRVRLLELELDRSRAAAAAPPVAYYPSAPPPSYAAAPGYAPCGPADANCGDVAYGDYLPVYAWGDARPHRDFGAHHRIAMGPRLSHGSGGSVLRR